jgi:hypothetical protein
LTVHSPKDFREDPYLATAIIARQLAKGRLNLFLGAGVSAGFGLPNWTKLVARVLDHEDDYSTQLDQMSEPDVAKLLDPLDDASSKYQEKVHRALYKTAAPDLLRQLSVSPLLLAVAGLLTGSCRGRIQRVFTYNYDDLLEQYLRMLGYACCVRTAPNDLSDWSDVEINYVHGYLPKSWKPDQPIYELILSNKSFRNRRADIDRGWSASVENSLCTKLGLFMGLSGDDSSIFDVLKRAQKQVGRGTDPLGFWLMTPDAYDRNAGSVQDVNMSPLRLAKEDFPEFVFRVCQKAVGDVS